MTETKKNCRKQTGNLKINNKLHPIYEGLNIIGRDTKATVLVKETVFSKLHSAISVLDNNIHLISDLNSSNGTYLGELRLIPFKFYPIKDHEHIIFGDVVSVYFKDPVCQNSVNRVENVGHEACTQIITKLNTSENIHDLPTQSLNNIYEATTQFFENKNTSNYDINDSDDSTQDFNNDLSRTEVYDDILANESFRSSLEQPVNGENVEVDETVLVDSQFKKPNPIKDDDVMSDDDIILSTQDSEAIDRKYQEHQKEMNSSKDKLEENDSDATDVDDDLLVENVQDISCLREIVKTPEIENEVIVRNEDISDEEEIDLLAETSAAKEINSSDEIPNTQLLRVHLKKDITSKIEDACFVATQKLSNGDSESHERATQILPLVNGIEKTPESIKTVKTPEKVVRNDDESFCEAETQFLPPNTPKMTKIPEKQVPKIEETLHDAETQFLPPVSPKTAKTSENFVYNNEEIFHEAETQFITTEIIKTPEKLIENEEEVIFEAPTQFLSPETSEITKTVETSQNQAKPEKTPKNLVENEEAQIQVETTESDETQILVPEKLVEDEGEAIFEAQTQILSTKSPKTVETSENQAKSEGIAKELVENKEEEAIFEAQTQILPLETLKTVETLGSDEETQILASETTKSKAVTKKLDENEEEEAIFEAQTQILPSETLTSEIQIENDKEIYEAQTQICHHGIDLPNEEDYAFSAPTQILSLENKEKSNEEEGDDVFLAPTQILDDIDSWKQSGESNEESMHLHLSETEPSASTLSPEELEEKQQQNTETQLEVSFELETQKLYIEEKTKRPNNPLSHLFAEETETETTDEQNEDLNTSIVDKMKLTPIVSIVDIKKSKITMKDIQEASTSKIKKSYVKLERIKQEPTRRSNRNNKMAETVESEASETPELLIEEEKQESVDKEEKTAKPKTKIEEIRAKAEKSTRRRTNLEELKELVKDVKVPFEEKSVSSSSTLENLKESEEELEGKTSRSETLKDIKEIQAPLEGKTRRRTTVPSSSKPENLEESEKEIQEPPEDKTKRRIKVTSSEKLKESIKEIKAAPEGKTRSKTRIASSSSSSVNFKKSIEEQLQAAPKEKYLKKSLEEEIQEPSEEKTKSRTKITSSPTTSEKLKESIEGKISRKTRIASSTSHSATLNDSEEETKKSVINTNSEDSFFRIKTRGKRCDYKSILQGGGEGRITSKSFMREKIEELEIHIKEKPTKRKTEASDSEDSILKSKRTKKNEEIIEVDVRKNTRNTKPTKLEKLIIENSDESPKKNRKRTNQISPERLQSNTKISSDICLNTSNTKRRKYENINSSQLNNDSEHKVVFTMLNDSKLENIVKKLGGSIVDSIHSCTVLVTNKISRSLKFLIALALGKPIVHIKWLLDSDKRKKFLDPWDYLLEDPENEAKFKMSLKESLQTSKNKKLLTGETILLTTSKNFDVLKEIIETSGGKCVTKAPPKNTSAVVVCYEDEKSKYSRYLKQKSFVVVSAEAIFTGVLKQKLNWKQYLLS